MVAIIRRDRASWWLQLQLQEQEQEENRGISSRERGEKVEEARRLHCCRRRRTRFWCRCDCGDYLDHHLPIVMISQSFSLSLPRYSVTPPPLSSSDLDEPVVTLPGYLTTIIDSLLACVALPICPEPAEFSVNPPTRLVIVDSKTPLPTPSPSRHRLLPPFSNGPEGIPTTTGKEGFARSPSFLVQI